ncbi:hypothetical protein [Sinomicrobium sp.]
MALLFFVIFSGCVFGEELINSDDTEIRRVEGDEHVFVRFGQTAAVNI